MSSTNSTEKDEAPKVNATLENLPDTPMWKQFAEIKKDAPDSLLMYRMGDFYELFLDDAVAAAPILGIALTARNKKGEVEIPMCGVPFHSATNYINKLLQAGKRVAICEQTSPPGKGIVERKIVRVVSPGMVFDQDALEAKETNYLLALDFDLQAWQKGNDEIGAYCAIDVSTGEILYSSFGSLHQLQDDLAVLRPREVVVSLNLIKNCDWERIKQEIGTEYFPCISTTNEMAFSKTAAWELLCKHFNVINLDAFSLTKTSIALGAVGAAFRKVIDTQLDSPLCHLNQPKPFVKKQFLHLDESTIEHLDLFIKKDRGAEESLFHHLDKTSTAMGARELKKMIARPLAVKSQIVMRQKAIHSLLKAPARKRQLRAQLQGILDIERLLAKLGLKTAGPRDLIALKNAFLRTLEIKDLLGKVKDSVHLSALNEEIADLSGLGEMIGQRLVDEPPAHMRDGNVMKHGWHEKLDELILLSTDGAKYIADLEAREREQTGIQSLKVKFNKVFGFFIEVTKTNLNNVPDHYIRKQTTANGERYITDELKKMEDRLLRAQDQRIALEQELFNELLDIIIGKAKLIQYTAGALAKLDALIALTVCAEEYRYTCPDITENDQLYIEDGRHPVIEHLVGTDKYIANSLEFNAEKQFHLITGPNMAGKSTYMRQSALLILMAQMGSFIPAGKAKIGIVDRIASRVGASDRIGRGQSTFLVEMNEMARILHQSTPKSFLIVDEIGRGTSTFDGMALAWSIAEDIASRLGCRTLFATHYHELTDLAGKHKNVTNLHVEVAEQNNTIVFLHTIKEGKASGSYGIEVAKLAGLPQNIIENARDRLRDLENSSRKKGARKALNREHQLDLFGAPAAPAKPEPKVDPMIEKMIEEIRKLDVNATTPIQALQAIQKWQASAIKPVNNWKN